MFNWFSKLFGFAEYGVKEGKFSRSNYALTQSEFSVLNDDAGNVLIRSNRNDRIFIAGKFEALSLGELRELSKSSCSQELSFRHEAISDVFAMHSKNAGATFQAASQFNCLEFGSPHVTPG
jgi:hypothetical protein